VLAGAWSGLVMRYRSSARWWAWGIGAGLVGAALVVASVASLTLLGATG
jgi:hypothetical protein